MKLYELCHQVNNEDSYIEVEEKQIADIFKFFIMGMSINNITITKRLTAFAQSGLTENLLSHLDAVNAIINIPVFSENFQKKPENFYIRMLIFIPALLITNTNITNVK